MQYQQLPALYHNGYRLYPCSEREKNFQARYNIQATENHLFLIKRIAVFYKIAINESVASPHKYAFGIEDGFVVGKGCSNRFLIP